MNWKTFLVKRLTGAKTLPPDFSQKVRLVPRADHAYFFFLMESGAARSLVIFWIIVQFLEGQIWAGGMKFSSTSPQQGDNAGVQRLHKNCC